MQQAPEYHVPVLGPEASELLVTDSDGVYVDATLGGGGHAEQVSRRLGPRGRLIGIDRDPEAIQEATRRFSGEGLELETATMPFWRLQEAMDLAGLTRVHGVLFDLGLSSRQIDDAQRGFSYEQDGPLDMRMGPDAEQTAADVVNGSDEADLIRILRSYGEERQAQQIVRSICRRRLSSPIERTGELRQIVTEATPGPHLQKRLARVFQAIRIAVNGELDRLEESLDAAADVLLPGGRLAVLSYHSLEDRIVKLVFRSRVKGCTCPPDLPICRCGRTPSLKVITPKGVRATPLEVSRNPRARSATLRVAERLE